MEPIEFCQIMCCCSFVEPNKKKQKGVIWRDIYFRGIFAFARHFYQAILPPSPKNNMFLSKVGDDETTCDGLEVCLDSLEVT